MKKKIVLELTSAELLIFLSTLRACKAVFIDEGHAGDAEILENIYRRTAVQLSPEEIQQLAQESERQNQEDTKLDDNSDPFSFEPKTKNKMVQ